MLIPPQQHTVCIKRTSQTAIYADEGLEGPNNIPAWLKSILHLPHPFQDCHTKLYLNSRSEYHAEDNIFLVDWAPCCWPLTCSVHGADSGTAAWQSWVPQNPRSAPPHCPQPEKGWGAACSGEQKVAVGPLKEWILPSWEALSARLQTHSNAVQWNVIRHTAACGSNQRSFLPFGSSGTFDVTNQDLKGWSSRIQSAKGLWFLSVHESTLP